MSEGSGIKSVVVVGGGISGLCAAYWLQQKGVKVTLLERDSSVGGTMKTIHENGWLIETGPNSTLETTPLFGQLFEQLAITDQRVYASEVSNNRYILRNGKLHPLPMSPGAFINSKLWTLSGKLRLLKEPFIGRAHKEESIAEFVERRLGLEFLDYAINPFVAGVYAGSPEQLSVQSAFPKLYALEEKYGGLIKGMIKGRKDRKQRAEKAKDRARMFSFTDGMYILPKAIAAKLGDSINLNCSVQHIIPIRAGKYPVYTISYEQDGQRMTLEADAVVLAAPAHAISSIIKQIDPAMAKTLESIYYPPVTEVFMGFKKEQIRRPLDGFGYLIPSKEKKNILGTIWSSTIFPNRAPAGYEAFTTFTGGARQPELTENTDEQIANLVFSDLQSIIGIDGKPAFMKIIRWQKAIPQYNVGYGKILKAMDMFERNFQRAFFCGNFRGGISVGDCVMSAEKVVERIMKNR